MPGAAAMAVVSPPPPPALRRKRGLTGAESLFVLILATYLAGVSVLLWSGDVPAVRQSIQEVSPSERHPFGDGRRLTDVWRAGGAESASIRTFGNHGNSTVLSPPPEGDNDRVIFLISFPTDSSADHLLRRCIISLRRRGKWTGYIVVLTTPEAHEYYEETMGKIDSYLRGDDRKIIVVSPTEELLSLTDRQMTQPKMKIKHYKTYALDFINEDPRTAGVNTVLYMDIDIVAGDDLNALVDGARTMYDFGGHSDRSHLYFFEDLRLPLHGGVMLMNNRHGDGDNSQKCLLRWREQQISEPGRQMDQIALLKIWDRIGEGTEKSCQLVQMDREPGRKKGGRGKIRLQFPRNYDLDLMAHAQTYPSLIHITNQGRGGLLDAEKQDNFFKAILQLTANEESIIGHSVRLMQKDGK